MTDNTQLNEARRQQIFQALVYAQDEQASVLQSRRQVAAQFGITEEDLRKIEREGLDHTWPPL